MKAESFLNSSQGRQHDIRGISLMGVRGGQRVRRVTLKTEPRVVLGTYFVQEGQLYYVIDFEYDTHNFLIENCSSLVRQWRDFEDLETADIMIVGRG